MLTLTYFYSLFKKLGVGKINQNCSVQMMATDRADDPMKETAKACNGDRNRGFWWESS